MGFAYSSGCQCCPGDTPGGGTANPPNCNCSNLPASLAVTMTGVTRNTGVTCGSVPPSNFQSTTLTFAPTAADAPAFLPSNFRLANRWYSPALTVSNSSPNLPSTQTYQACYYFQCNVNVLVLGVLAQQGSPPTWVDAGCMFRFSVGTSAQCSPFRATTVGFIGTGNNCIGADFLTCGGTCTVAAGSSPQPMMMAAAPAGEPVVTMAEFARQLRAEEACYSCDKFDRQLKICGACHCLGVPWWKAACPIGKW